MAENKIFREQALSRLASPERLNELVKITSPKSWLAISAVYVLIIVAIVWGFTGEIPKKVSGMGILIQSGGIVDITSIAQGRLKQFSLKEGDLIKKGDIIATIDQPELEMLLQNDEKSLADLQNRYNKVFAFDAKELNMKRDLLLKKQKIVEATIESKNEQIKFMDEQINAQNQLLKDGLITKETLNNTKVRRFNVQSEYDQSKNELKNINLELFEISGNNELTLNVLENSLLEKQRHITELKSKLQIETYVKSSYNGRIVELLVNPGDLIKTGSPLISMEVSAQQATDLEAIIYVSPQEGKLLSKAMRVRISPSTVESEEYGYMTGEVDKVSEYPATQEGMFKTLGNHELVQTFLKGSPPIAVYIKLDKDEATFSKFKWTSIKGPDVAIKSGTLCRSDIVVEKRRPISLLMPGLK